ncbi:MAG: hypothetical protein Q8S33_35635 [Myxococcales bacterium]|nr:hypothetical protein [Myxococcales bacterium]
MRVGLMLIVVSLAACSEPPPPPPTPVAVAKPPSTAVDPVPVVDAGAPAVLPPDTLDGVTTEGVPDDPQLSADDLRDATLQKMLLRDPDRVIRVLEQAPAPSSFQVAVLAALAIRRRVEGPPLQVKESPLPTVPASGKPIAGPGAAFVGVQLLELRAGPGKGKVLASIPTGTQLVVDKVTGANAAVSVELATRVVFGTEGGAPKQVVTKTVKGFAPLDSLVDAPPDTSTLAAEATTQPDTDLGHDISLVLWHRAFLLSPTETVRAQLLAAAWKARRPSWVAAAALEPVWVAPRSLRVAWACKGDLLKAKWAPLSPKPPADVCFSGVDVRQPCTGDVPASLTKRKELLSTLGLTTPAPVMETVVDASRARRLWLVSLPVRSTSECEEVEEHKIDVFGAVIRRLQLPLGTASMVVSVPVSGWHGVEHSVIGAQSEAKARDWLRSRVTSKWTYDARGEPAPSLGVGDTSFRLERDVATASVGRIPEMNCELCGGSSFR